MPDVPAALRTPLRAVVGLAAILVDEAKRLPDRALELPMMAISRTLQLSLRAQQQYAAMAARGEQVLDRSKVTDEAPEWATFDEVTVAEELAAEELVAAELATEELVAEELAAEQLVADQLAAEHLAADTAPPSANGAGAPAAGSATESSGQDRRRSGGSKTGGTRRDKAPSAFDIVADPDADPETGDVVPDTD